MVQQVATGVFPEEIFLEAMSVDEINAYFTIDKNELPEDLRYDMNKKIEAISIPPTAKIKDFFIQWY